jgi:hypothetical protein
MYHVIGIKLTELTDASPTRRRIPVATSRTIFWAPMTRITCPAPEASGPGAHSRHEAVDRARALGLLAPCRRRA